MVAQLGVGETQLSTDPAFSPQLLRPPAGRLVAVLVGDVLQEDFLRQSNELESLAGAKHAAKDFEGVLSSWDSDEFVDILLVSLQDPVLLHDVLHHILKVFEASVSLVPGLADIAVEERVRMDLAPEENAKSNVS